LETISFSPDFPPWLWKGGALQAAEKPCNAVILQPVRCHSERSEGSRSAAQGKLREGSRSEYFQGNARFFVAVAPLQKLDA
jgi:hypothetical protein